ncbi:MAG: hypothetical protein ACLQVI_29990 [Polyangiaceae bacterium]
MNTSHRNAIAIAMLSVSPLALGAVGCGAPDGSPGSPAAASAPAAVARITPLPPVAPAQDDTSSSRAHPDGIVSGKNPGLEPSYQGGPLMTGTIDVVPIFYGTSWPTNYESTILSFLGSLSSTSYWAVVEGYEDGASHHPGALKIMPAVYENDHAHGTLVGGTDTLGDADIIDIVNEHGTPVLASSSAVYVVFTDDEVAVSDEIGELCEDYLGWHEQGTLTKPGGGSFTGQYALIGSPAYCSALEGSAWGGGAWLYGPNGYAIDEANTAAFHEIAESATDPGADGSGYYPEIGDICAWIPGPLTTVYYSLGVSPIEAKRSGEISLLKHYNYDLGEGAPYTSDQYGHLANQGTEYLVQTIWDTHQGGCAYGPALDDLIIIQ